jgi:hypothetical protein
MSRTLNMQHLHLGCGESLSQWLAEPLQRKDSAQAQPVRPRLKTANAAPKSKKGGGR